jgi:hypothetical protein
LIKKGAYFLDIIVIIIAPNNIIFETQKIILHWDCKKYRKNQILVHIKKRKKDYIQIIEKFGFV